MKQEEHLALLFLKIGKEFKKSFSSNDVKLDCSHKDMRIFEFLYSGPKSMKELAEEMNLTPGSMTTAIEKLVQQKFVKRVYDKEDRRKVSIDLLQKGKKIAEHMNLSSLTISNQMLDNLTSKERETLLNLLEKSTSNFN